jgi:hypothetical protein
VEISLVAIPHLRRQRKRFAFVAITACCDACGMTALPEAIALAAKENPVAIRRKSLMFMICSLSS